MRALLAAPLRHPVALAILGASLTVAPLQRVAAQQSAFLGRVLDATTERPISGAQVELRSLKLSARSDSAGTFRIGNVEPGTHVAIIRAVGYDSIVARLQIAANDSVDSDFLLTPLATSLNAVRVNASADQRYRIQLREFEERRAMPIGQFLDASYFEKNDGLRVSGLLTSRISGVRTTQIGPELLVSSRSGRKCFPQTIVNGIVRDKLDLNTLNAADIIGFEYYTVGTTPLKYNMTGSKDSGSQCGTAIFWMK